MNIPLAISRKRIVMVRLMALVNISYKEVGRSNLIDQKCGFSLTRLIMILNETMGGGAVVDYSVA